MKLPHQLRTIVFLCLPVLLIASVPLLAPVVQRWRYQHVSQYLNITPSRNDPNLDTKTLTALVDLMRRYPMAKTYRVEWRGTNIHPAHISFSAERQIFYFDDGCGLGNFCGSMVAGDDVEISRSELEEALSQGIHYSWWNNELENWVTNRRKHMK